MMLDYNCVSTCDYADALPREQFVDYTIHSLWQPAPAISGPAYTVYCAPGDHLMLHAAIYRARAGDIIVVEADDAYALAGGNVCAIAQRRGIRGLVVDGVIRDLAQVRDLGFAVYARGVMPKPAAKAQVAPLNKPVKCGGVQVNPGDIIVADEEGIAVIPASNAHEVLQRAKARAHADSSVSLEQWQTGHHKKVQSCLQKLGFTE